MFTTISRKSGIDIFAAMIVVSLLAACGNGDSSDPEPPVRACFETSIQNCGSGPWDPFGIALSLAWISGQCTQEVLCTDSEVLTNFDEGIVTDDFITRNWTTSSAKSTPAPIAP